MISSINFSVSDSSSTQGSHSSFSDDDDNDDKTSSNLVSDSTNEVSRFFSGGLVAFHFTGSSKNIKGTLSQA